MSTLDERMARIEQPAAVLVASVDVLGDYAGGTWRPGQVVRISHPRDVQLLTVHGPELGCIAGWISDDDA